MDLQQEPLTHRFSDDTGDAVIEVHSIFPGVQITFNSIHMGRCELGRVTEGNLIEIHHCREGRIEQAFDDELFYLGPGDFSIALREKTVDAYNFPTSHYHGITIGIHANKGPNNLSEYLSAADVEPLAVAKRLCGQRNSFFVRREKYIEHIFSELYTPMPPESRTAFYQVKFLELMLVLNTVKPTRMHQNKTRLQRNQVSLAEDAAEYLAQHEEERITIPSLAKQFHVSPTYLKECFRAVYGVPVSSFARIQKMQKAGRALIASDRKLAEIAAEFGYQSESKFTAAFQKIMGETPSEYRRNHRK